MTKPEIGLWGGLKRLHPEGYHFRRQRPFKGYFLDFLCIDRKLVIELDGGHHNEPRQMEHDGAETPCSRERAIWCFGFRIRPCEPTLTG